MTSRKPKPRKGIQSIEVGHRLLQVLANAPGPLALRDLAVAARMPPSKAHRYLVSYGRAGLIEQEGESGHYGLGSFALELGLAALGRLDPVSVALPTVRELAKSLDQTVALAAWANHGPTIVRWIGADSPVTATLRVGSVMPLSRSSTGLAFLAFLPEGRWRALLKRELQDNVRSGLKPRTIGAVTDQLTEIRSSGLAWTGDFIAGITGMAAPVFDADGSMTLALITLGYAAAVESRLSEIKSSLVQAARGLSTRLGNRPA
jgi:DNA-binding IclR family transcriptional regulator